MKGCTPEISSTMAVCLDRAPAVAYADIRRIVEEETGKPVEEVFEYFDPNPVASASIAQVHKAKLRDASGVVQDVAVKVQKPKIKRQVWWDLTTHHFVCWALEKTFDFPVLWGAQAITETMMKEIDFNLEADNIERASGLFKDRNDIVVPRVQREYLSQRLLITEWMEATKMSDIKTITGRYDTKAVMTTIVECFGDMMFRYGFVHCDPHPANVLVRPRPGDTSKHQVVLLDFGLCCDESEKFRHEFSSMFVALYSHNFAELDRIMKSWGIRHTELFASMMIQKPFNKNKKLASPQAQNISKEDVLAMQQKMKSQAKDLLADDRLVPRELIFVGRSMNIIRGLNKSYAAPVNRINMFASRALMTMEDGSAFSKDLAANAVNGGSLTRRQTFNTMVTRFVVSFLYIGVKIYVGIMSLIFGAPELPVSADPDDLLVGSDGKVRSMEDIIEQREQEAFSQHFGMNPHHHQLNISAND